MKLKSISVKDYPPIKHFEVSELGEIVIIAGENGSGKTRLKDAIIKSFQQPRKPITSMTIQATRESEEVKVWGSEELIIFPGNKNNTFLDYMATRTRGGTYTGSVIQIDSDRSIQPIKFEPIGLETPDPDDEELATTELLKPFSTRWPNIVNKIFQKAANRDNKIAQFVKKNQDKSNAETLDLIPDTFIQYQEIFTKLLPGKNLEQIDPKHPREFHYTMDSSDPLPFTELSSGEQEVIKIAFNLLWKKISHCIIFVDEPELHLHPTLTFRLIETLKDIGKGTNQYFFLTHSADLISTYYSTGNVYFIDCGDTSGNQAKSLSTIDEKHNQTARALGSNLGIFTVGKKLVFVEGENASIDRLTYHKLSQEFFPEAYILPIGSVENILTLDRLSNELQQSIYGIDFFMIRDRDGLSDEQISSLEKNPRFKCLRRRHVENYFLDENVLCLVAERLYLDTEWTKADFVEEKLKEIAESLLNVSILLSMKQYITLNGTIDSPRVANAREKSVEDIQSEFISLVEGSHSEVDEVCNSKNLAKKFNDEQIRFQKSLKGSTWKVLFPGKLIFNNYCGMLKQSPNQVRQAYLDIAIMQNSKTFNEIRNILTSFSKLN